VTISPEDIIADGARPDGQSKPSQGSTQEQARVGGAQEPKPEAKPPEPRGDEGKNQIARNTNPDAIRLPNLLDRAGRIASESLEESRKRYVQNGPQTGIQNGIPENPNFSTEEPTILSDTRGYDFGPYMNQVVNRVRLNWYSLIPEIARLGKRGRVVVIFTITESGAVTDLRLVANSGTDPLDRAAQGSITASNPFPKLPSNFDGNHIVLQFTFLYNLK
jgi:TonB family protein